MHKNNCGFFLSFFIKKKDFHLHIFIYIVPRFTMEKFDGKLLFDNVIFKGQRVRKDDEAVDVSGFVCESCE
jgi:hypothetical protein